MKHHHFTFDGIMFTILLLCAIFINIADFNKTRSSWAFDRACDAAKGQIVTEFVCVKPGSIINLNQQGYYRE